MDFGGFPSSPPPRRRRNAMADITACREDHMPPQHGSYASYAPTAMRQHPQPTFEQQYHHNHQAFQHPAHYGGGGHGPHYTGATQQQQQPPPAQPALHMHGHMPDVDMDLDMGGLHIGHAAGAGAGAGAGHAQPFGFQGFQQQQQPDGFVFPGAEACMGGMGGMGAPLSQQYSGDSDALSCGSDNAHDFDMEMRPASRRGSRRDSRRNAVSAEDQAAIMAHFDGM